MKPRRGTASLIVAILVLTALAVSLPTLFFYVYTSRVRQEARALSYLEVEDRARYVDLDAVAVISQGVLELVVWNRGGKEVVIEGVLALSGCGSERAMLRLSGSGEVLRPGSAYRLTVNLRDPSCPERSVGGVYVVTSEPRVYSVRLYNMTAIEGLGPAIGEELGALVSVIHVLIPVEVRADPWDVVGVLREAGFALAEPDSSTSPSRLVLSGDYSALESGVESASGRWISRSNFSNVEISATGLRVRNVFLGYDPGEPSKYVLLLTNDGSVTLNVGGTQMAFCSAAARVKIYGFESSNPGGVIYVNGDQSRFGSGGTWIRKPYQDVANLTFLDRDRRGQIALSGRARRVEVYCFEPGQVRASSYAPYLLLMNTAGSRGAGVLLTTIDAVYGFSTNRNDLSGTGVALQDHSARPLALVYRRLAIDNNNTRAVLIALNYRFHDNEGQDFYGVTVDRPVVILGLVDEEGRILSYRSFTFRELTRYEDTYPPAAQAQSALALIPLPPADSAGFRRFYVFLIIQDPYLYNTGNSNLDDLDLTLYIESLAVLLFE